MPGVSRTWHATSMQQIRHLPHAGFKLADDGVKIVTQLDSSGRPLNSGLAYVRFETAAEAQRAAAIQHRKTMGNRYIECLPVSPTQRMVRTATGN